MRLQWAGHVTWMRVDRKYIQNFCGETSCKTAIWKTKKEMRWVWNCLRVRSSGWNLY